MRRSFVFILLASLAGCGPLFIPMTPHLAPDDQRTVDQMWDNMLTPVQRVDRVTLLDANVAFMLFTLGVDRLHMRSEKYFRDGTVVMEIDCDRASPDADQYTITVLDHRGRTLRRERYSRADVEESARMMQHPPNFIPQIATATMTPATQPVTQPATATATQPATTQPETAEERKYRLEFERRYRAVFAATQPARLDSNQPGGSPLAR